MCYFDKQDNQLVMGYDAESNFVTMTYNQFVTAGTAKGASYVGTYYDSSKFGRCRCQSHSRIWDLFSYYRKKERNTARDVNQGIGRLRMGPGSYTFLYRRILI